MNKEFARFKKFYTRVKHNYTTMDSSRGKKLVELCNEHAKSNTSNIIGEKNIIAVHPYHYHLGWTVDPDEEIKPREQIVRLENILRNADPSYNRILFENILHYAMKTHELVEEGIIDKVIFTHPKTDKPIDYGELKDFSKSKINYVGGVYEFQCVLAMMNAIRKFTEYSKVRPIKDGVINNEWGFWDKFWARRSPGIILEGGSTKYFFYERIFSMLFGKKSKQLLKQN